MIPSDRAMQAFQEEMEKIAFVAPALGWVGKQTMRGVRAFGNMARATPGKVKATPVAVKNFLKSDWDKFTSRVRASYQGAPPAAVGATATPAAGATATPAAVASSKLRLRRASKKDAVPVASGGQPASAGKASDWWREQEPWKRQAILAGGGVGAFGTGVAMGGEG